MANRSDLQCDQGVEGERREYSMRTKAVTFVYHAIPQAAEPAQQRAWQQWEGGAEVATATHQASQDAGL